MNGLPYYPRYPRDFLDGTVGMPLETKGAYAIVLDLIYMMGDRGLPDDPQFISGHLGCSVRKWNSLRKTLIELGKLTSENGLLNNVRADKEKIIQRTYQDKQSEKRRRPNKNKGLESPQSHHTDTYTVTNVTGSETAEEDFGKQVFDRAVAYLGRHGVSEDSARQFVGQMRKKSTDTEIFEAFATASKAGAVDPVTYVRGVLKPKPKRHWEKSPRENTLERL